MKARTVALILLVGVAAIACTPNQEDEALSDVRQVCIDLGYGDDESEDSSDDSGTTTSAEWEELADAVDEVANQAARAARLDRRWDRLSNAVTDGQALAEEMAIASDETQPVFDRNTAQEQVDQLDPDGILQVMRQECRKAQAE